MTQITFVKTCKRHPCPYLGSLAKNKFHEYSDIADLSKAEGLFLHQIMTTGERIKFNHDVFHKYIMKAPYFYEDFLPIQRACRAERIKRFVNGDCCESSLS